MIIKKGTIVKTKVDKPVKVVTIGIVDDVMVSTLFISKAIVSISDSDFVDVRHKFGNEKLLEHLNQCEIIQDVNDFDSIYDIIGRELFK